MSDSRFVLVGEIDDFQAVPLEGDDEFIQGLPEGQEITFSLDYNAAPPMLERDVTIGDRKIGRGTPRFEDTPDGRVLKMDVMVEGHALRKLLRPQAMRRFTRKSRHPSSKGMRRHIRRAKAAGTWRAAGAP